MTTQMKHLTSIFALASAMALSVPAFAQDTTAPAETAPDATAPAVPAAPETTAPVTPAPDATAPDATVTEPADTTMTPTTEAPTAFMVPEGYAIVSEWTGVTADQLKGATLYSGEGDNIGTISDIQLGTDGAIQGLITDVGGFLGIGAHTISLATDQVTLYRNEGGTLIAHTNLNGDALKALPEYVAPQ